MEKQIVLTVTDLGRINEGIQSISWDIPFPYLLELHKGKPAWTDLSMLELFRNRIRDAYKNFCLGGCVARYDYEIKDTEEYKANQSSYESVRIESGKKRVGRPRKDQKKVEVKITDLEDDQIKSLEKLQREEALRKLRTL